MKVDGNWGLELYPARIGQLPTGVKAVGSLSGERQSSSVVLNSQAKGTEVSTLGTENVKDK